MRWQGNRACFIGQRSSEAVVIGSSTEVAAGLLEVSRGGEVSWS